VVSCDTEYESWSINNSALLRATATEFLAFIKVILFSWQKE
jgi:hypothetical protein